MSVNVYVGIDPSFSRTGIAIYREDTNSVYISAESLDSEKTNSFGNTYLRAKEQSGNIIRVIKSVCDDLDKKVVIVLTECPPPQGSWSPGLYALDTLLIARMQANKMDVAYVYPNYLGFIHGMKKYPKSLSSEVGNKIIQLYESHLLRSGRLAHDEAEALIILMRNLAAHGKLDERVRQIIPKIDQKKEQIISERW